MKLRHLSLNTKIMLSLIVSAFFLCLIIFSVFYSYLRSNLINDKIDNIYKLNKEQVDESVGIFKNDQTFAKMLGTSTRVKEYLLDPSKIKEKELLNIFNDYAKENSKYLSLYLLNKKGIAVISTDLSFVNQNYSFRQYFKEGILGRPYMDLLLGKTSNMFGYYFSYPVFDDDKNVLGVFVVKINDKEIDLAILNSESAKENTVMLVDSYGIVVASNKPERFLKSLGPLGEKEKKNISESKKYLDREILPLQYDLMQKSIIDGDTFKTFEFKDKEDDDKEILYMNKLGEFPFYLVSEIGLEKNNRDIYKMILMLVGLIFLGVILSGFFIYKLINVSLLPLKKMRILAEKISVGDFSEKIDIKTEDELGILARVFNKMSENLKDSYLNLDKKIEDKTKEIEAKAKELSDQKVAMLNILEDIEREKNTTELLANDLEKYKLAVENASDQVVITDRDGIVIFANKAMERITGYTPEEALGKKAGTLWKTPMPNEYYEKMWDIIKNQKKVFIDEIQNRRKNGELYIANISISPVLNESGAIIFFVAIEHDITKEKEIDKAKTEFVSLASHQLRTPLSAINWYTEMLLSGDAGKINKEQKKYLTEVAIGNKRMVDLVNSLLNVSRLDLGTFIIEPEIVDVVDMAKSVISELKPLILEKKIKIEENYGKGVSKFSADKKLFRMIFQNLLSNSVKYTAPGGFVNLSINYFKKGDVFGGRKIEEESFGFSVSDSGMGVPENQKDKIFEKLFRADNARESETEGTGLGLYVIKSIVDQSGGAVWFISEEKKGSTFYILFSFTGMKKKEGTKKLD